MADLPAEIWQLIFRFCEIPTLRRLRLLSRNYHALLEDFLKSCPVEVNQVETAWALLRKGYQHVGPALNVPPVKILHWYGSAPPPANWSGEKLVYHSAGPYPKDALSLSLQDVFVDKDFPSPTQNLELKNCIFRGSYQWSALQKLVIHFGPRNFGTLWTLEKIKEIHFFFPEVKSCNGRYSMRVKNCSRLYLDGKLFFRGLLHAKIVINNLGYWEIEDYETKHLLLTDYLLEREEPYQKHSRVARNIWLEKWPSQSFKIQGQNFFLHPDLQPNEECIISKKALTVYHGAEDFSAMFPGADFQELFGNPFPKMWGQN